jgi:hypothetical protein
LEDKGYLKKIDAMSDTKRLAENGRLQIFGMEYPWLRLTATSTGQRLPEKCIVMREDCPRATPYGCSVYLHLLPLWMVRMPGKSNRKAT